MSIVFSLLIIMALPAAAAVYNINFTSPGGYDSAPTVNMNPTAWDSSISPAAYLGSTWNDIYPTGAWYSMNINATNLLDSEGNSSSIGFTSGADAHWGYNANLDVLSNYTFTENRQRNFTISGLNAGAAYDIYIMSTGGADDQTGRFTIGSEVRETADDDSVNNHSNTMLTEWIEGRNYVRFSGISADATGNISGMWEDINRFAAINGIQIVEASPVPIPAAAWLFGSGLIGLAFRSRKGK
jgi:hypothetical protein